VQQSPDELPSVQAEQQHTGKVRNRMVGLGVALFAAVVVTTVVVVNVSGSDDSDPHVLTSRAVGELREGLVDDGWRCYDMGDQPVATECYLWRARPSYDHYETTSVLTMRYAGPDALAEVLLDAPPNGDPRDEVVADTAALVDQTLLSHLPGRNLRTLPTAHDIFQEIVDGIHVQKVRDGFVLQSRDLVRDVDQIEPEPLPAARQTRAALQKQGFDCEAEQGENGTQYIACVRNHQGLRISAHGSLDGADVNNWSFQAHDSSSPDSMRIDDAARVLATTAREAGLTDDEGAMFIQENPQTRQQGVFGGYHLEIQRAGRLALDVTIKQFDP